MINILQSGGTLYVAADGNRRASTMNGWKFRVDVPAIVLIAALTVGGFTTPALSLTEEEGIFEKGKDDLFIGNYYRAASRFRRLLGEYPETKFKKEALLLLSTACLKSGRMERAKEHMRELVREYPRETGTLTPELRMLAGIEQETAPPSAPPASQGGQSPFHNVFSNRVPFVPPVPARESDPAVPRPKREPRPQRTDEERAKTVAREPAPAEASPSQAPPGREVRQYYTVVAGEPLTPAKRDALLKKLRKEGIDPMVTSTEKTFTVHRLLGGSYDSGKEAEMRREEIRNSCGGSPFVMKIEGAHCVFAGSYASRENAATARKTMAKKGVHVEVMDAEAPLKVWRVIAGRYASEDEAKAVATALTEKGVGAKIERGGE